MTVLSWDDGVPGNITDEMIVGGDGYVPSSQSTIATYVCWGFVMWFLRIAGDI